MKKLFCIATMLFAFAISASAQLVGATNNQPSPNPIQNDSPLYHPTGPALRLSAGLNIYGSAAYDYYITPSLMIGIGTGVTEAWIRKHDSDGYSTCEAFFPLFLEAEIRTPKYGWSLFLNVKSGYLLDPLNYNAADPFFVSAMAGFGYKNLNLGFGVSTMGNYNFENIVLSISYDLPFTTLNRIFN